MAAQNHAIANLLAGNHQYHYDMQTWNALISAAQSQQFQTSTTVPCIASSNSNNLLNLNNQVTVESPSSNLSVDGSHSLDLSDNIQEVAASTPDPMPDFSQNCVGSSDVDDEVEHYVDLRSENQAAEFDKELFLVEIRKYKCLWDIKSPSYKERNTKANAWMKLAATFGRDGKDISPN